MIFINILWREIMIILNETNECINKIILKIILLLNKDWELKTIHQSDSLEI